MRFLSKLLSSLLLFLSVGLQSEETKSFSLHLMMREHFASIFQNGNPSTVIYVEAGTRLPIYLKSTGDIFSIESPAESACLLVNKPFYVKVVPPAPTADCALCDTMQTAMEETTFFFSHDQIAWENFENFFSGNIQAGVSSDEDHPTPSLLISIDLKFEN